jgi:regulator of replication initiation timing
MAFFNKKQYESEIERLDSELLKMQNKLNEQIKNLERDNFNLLNEVELLRTKLQEKEYINQMILFNNSELLKQVAEKEEQTNARNARGAGRKSKATHENIAEIARLHNEGLSYAQISKHMNHVSKSTVAKIIKEYCG